MRYRHFNPCMAHRRLGRSRGLNLS
jgi:hypothetical protein